MKKLFAALWAGVACLVLMLGGVTVPASPVAARSAANGLPNCGDPRQDAESTFIDGSVAQQQHPLCVCAANASGCSAVTVQQCKAYDYWRLKTIAPGQQVCVYALRGNPPQYWAQRIIGPLGVDSPIVTPAVMPNCTDDRHEAEYSYADARSPTPKPLCVCAARASGCSAVTTQACKADPAATIFTAAPNKQVCVYALRGPQYWGQWITDPQAPSPKGGVCASKYNDLNGDGRQQQGEPNLPGWTFSIWAGTSTAGRSLMTGTTGAGGSLVWCTGKVLPEGQYTLAEAPQAGWTNTEPGGGRSTIKVIGGRILLTSFGNHRAGAVKPASFTMDCAKVAASGFTVTTSTQLRTKPAQPRPGSYAIPGVTYGVGPLREYGQAGMDRVFFDSFTLNPGMGQRNLCRIDVAMKGRIFQGGSHARVFAPTAPGVILANGHWQNGGVLGGYDMALMPGPWNFTLTIDGTGTQAGPLAAALASPMNALDIAVFDDASIESAGITWYFY